MDELNLNENFLNEESMNNFLKMKKNDDFSDLPNCK